MKHRIFYHSITIVIFIILLSTVVGLLIKQQHFKNSNRKMSEYLEKCNELFSIFSKTLSIFVQTSGMSIPDIRLIDSHGNQKMLSEIIENEKMLVYLPKISCNTCTIRETELINVIFGEKVKNVMIVSNFQSLREQIVFEKETHIATYSLKRGESFPIPEYGQHIVLSLVSKTLYAYCFLLPDDKMDKISEIYYQSVAKKFQML